MDPTRGSPGDLRLPFGRTYRTWVLPVCFAGLGSLRRRCCWGARRWTTGPYRYRGARGDGAFPEKEIYINRSSVYIVLPAPRMAGPTTACVAAAAITLLGASSQPASHPGPAVFFPPGADHLAGVQLRGHPPPPPPPPICPPHCAPPIPKPGFECAFVLGALTGPGIDEYNRTG